MPKDDIVRVRHATDAARKALSFVKDRCREDLDSDEMLALSLIRLLEVIGEAAIGISNEIRESHPDVPWNKMVGMRNRLIHGYFDINLDVVWDTVVNDLPPLIEDLENIVAMRETS